jgi:dUTP pyrophosphatase
MEIKLCVYPIFADSKIPKFATEGSACFDIAAYLSEGSKPLLNGQEISLTHGFVSIEPGDIALIPTGIILDIPNGHSVRLHPRSELALSGLTLVNCEGVIDADYVNELKVAMINHSKSDIVVSHGQRIAQGELMKNYEYSIVETLTQPSNTTRAGGFGSTGK